MFDKSVIGTEIQPFEKKVWLASPTMHGEEIEYVKEAYETNWMSTVGANINEVERLASEKIGTKHAVALSTGTASLHMAVKLAGEKVYGKPAVGYGALHGKKVFCSDMTFDATVNPIVYEGGIPVFIDTEYDTWNMDPVALEKAFVLYPEVKIVVLAHLYGVPAKIDEIQEICDRNNAILIEDAAESMGATYKGVQTGVFGEYNAISFNGNKIITGSSGGMLLTYSKEAAEKVRKWSTQAREKADWYQHEELGYGKCLEPKSELAFLDNSDWLFYTDKKSYGEKGCISKAVIRLNKSNTRGNIKISLGANDLILDMISQKENEGECLVDYLAQAKWIHISSMPTFEQFEKIMEYVIKAKDKNRFLKVSIDPGDEYTRINRNGLQKHLKNVDYVFLNEKELNNLVINEDLPENDKLIRLSTYFNNPHNVNTKAFIIKRKNSHKMIDFVNRIPYVYYHRKLAFYKINNDTGAGDCFAGGFIAGMLSERLIAHQPYAIQIGTLAAKERMKSMSNFSVYENICGEVGKFFKKKYKNGTFNWRQRALTFFQSKVDFIIGGILSFIGSLLISYIIAILEKI